MEILKKMGIRERTPIKYQQKDADLILTAGNFD